MTTTPPMLEGAPVPIGLVRAAEKEGEEATPCGVLRELGTQPLRLGLPMMPALPPPAPLPLMAAGLDAEASEDERSPLVLSLSRPLEEGVGLAPALDDDAEEDSKLGERTNSGEEGPDRLVPEESDDRAGEAPLSPWPGRGGVFKRLASAALVRPAMSSTLELLLPPPGLLGDPAAAAAPKAAMKA